MSETIFGEWNFIHMWRQPKNQEIWPPLPCLPKIQKKSECNITPPLSLLTDIIYKRYLTRKKKYLIGKKKKQWKVTNFLVVTNIFAQLKLAQTKNFYLLFFLLNKNQITV